jgi:tetratricopeptide (TPR) repeat protein
MASTATVSEAIDVFLSHGTPDKPWVHSLEAELKKLGLRVYVDDRVLEPGQVWPLELADAIARSRSMALVVSAAALQRPWVALEWPSFLETHGATAGRLIPVLIDEVKLPPLLNALQAVRATHRDAAQAAKALADRLGRLGSGTDEKVAGSTFGQHLVFVLQPIGDKQDRVAVIDAVGRRRQTTAPSSRDGFRTARLLFDRLSREPIQNDADRAELQSHARLLGQALFDTLFDDNLAGVLQEATRTGMPRPLLTIRSDDVALLALPWELLHHAGRFLVRDRVIDLVRSDEQSVGPGGLIAAAARPFSLVVNVSAPEESGLNYEAESYRITRALAGHCTATPTELGTLDDLAETVAQQRPTGIHFSGHGSPGLLLFEDDEGNEAPVRVGDLTARLRATPDGLLPPFFYLANCHGNDPALLEAGKPGVESLAAHLHRQGVAQVVAYSGPILDVLSTEAEAALYAAIAAGQTTRFAVEQAREVLTRPAESARSVLRQEPGTPAQAARDTHPFAWSQLVLYHRGPDHPLSQPVPPGKRRADDDAVNREFLDVGERRILDKGFIGRRTELHFLRRKVREGQRVFVLQGLGGLGKSTLAIHMVRDILHARADLCALWCQDAEKESSEDGIAEALVGQLLKYCRGRFGADWEQVVYQVDRTAGDDPARRIGLFLQALLQKVKRLVIYLDNLESLLVGPEEIEAAADPEAFGQWREPALAAIWDTLVQFSQATSALHVVASCRYRNDSFRAGLIPVSPLPADALFRLMGWFPALRRLSVDARARLVNRLDGHPRAVEFANDLVEHQRLEWEERQGREWRLPDPPGPGDLAREWSELVEPALPRVEAKLRDDLLLGAIWDRVLDDRPRRMLFRTTVLRRPWERDLVQHLGEPEETAEVAEATAQRLRQTSLLEAVDLRTRQGVTRHDTVHPATAKYVKHRFGDDPAVRLGAHRRVGEYYEAKAKSSSFIEYYFEAGHHLFQAGEYDRAFELLGPASNWLQQHGQVREGLRILEPFLAGTVRQALTPALTGQLLGTVGIAHYQLGQVERAIGFYEQRLVIARDIGDRQGEGAALGNLGLAYAALGQLERAIEIYEQRLVIAREIGDRHGEGNALGNLGTAYHRLGQLERAIEFLEQALVIDREIGDRRGEGTDLGNLGLAYYRLGQVERAIEFYEQQLVIVREIGDRRGEGNALGNLGLAYADLGQLERAIDYYYEQQLVIAREIGDRRGEGLALGNLGIAYGNLGQMARAESFLEQALRIGQEIRDPRIIQLATAQLERVRAGGGPGPSPSE